MPLLHEIGTGMRVVLMTEMERRNAKYHCGAPGDAPHAYPINSEQDMHDAWGLARHSKNPAHVRACCRQVAAKEGWTAPGAAKPKPADGAMPPKPMPPKQMPMGAPGYNAEKCAQRNRIAARRDGVDAVPLRLFRSDAPPAVADTGLLYAHGTLPATLDDALTRINAGLPEGGTPLVAEDVYVHYLEAANGGFVGDRAMFLGDATLRNIAQEAAAGVAFMNSHADGSLSHPAELPMGQTFAGRYEQDRAGGRRALIAFYMLRGVQPNGSSGPSTDDLHRMIVGGTTTDVSVGLAGGERICDLCGNDLNDEALCTHAPGTLRNVTAAQRTGQLARGVRKGAASYTLNDAHLREVSAVYDGAVPGAGFRKTLALARRHELTRADVLDASQVYARLLRKGDLPMDEIGELIEESTGNALTRFFGRSHRASRQLATVGEIEPEEMVLLESATTLVPDPDREALAAERATFLAEKAAFAREQYLARATGDVDRLIAEGRVLPAENVPGADGQLTLVALFAQALADDGAGAAIFAQAGGSRYAALLACFAARPAAPLGTEAIPVTIVPGDPAGPADPAAAAARKKDLLAQTATGRAALKLMEH